MTNEQQWEGGGPINWNEVPDEPVMDDTKIMHYEESGVALMSPRDRADLEEAGYDGSGWYFWDEVEAHCHGPFSTAEEARNAMEQYAEKL